MGKIKNTTKLLLLLTFSGLFLIVSNSQAAINSQINYQGKLTDDSGVAVADGSYDMIISIYDAVSGGSCLWTARGTCGSPTARSVSVSNGIFSIMLGDTGVGDNALTGLDFDDPYYLGITVESDSEMTPRKPIGATGYAFNSSMLNGLASATSGADAHILATDASGNATITGDISAANLSGTNTGDQALVDGTTAGQMAFWDGSNWTYTETSEMYWDDTNKMLGIGTNSPATLLDLGGGKITLSDWTTHTTPQNAGEIKIYNAAETTFLRMRVDGFYAPGDITHQTDGKLYFLGGNAAAEGILFGNSSTGAENLYIDVANNEVEARGNLIVGSGSAGVDYTLTFDGETNDGVLTWMEDENYLTIPNINLVASTATVGQIYQNGISIFNTYGTGNFFFGAYSGNLNGLGQYNTGIGEFALRDVTTNGDYNVALGRSALRKNTSGYRNMAIGYNALNANLTGSNNVAIGAFALWHNETGDSNFGMGGYALNSNISGLENIGIGNSTLGANTTGYYNVGIGNSALAQIQNNNSRNIAIGHYSGRYIANDSTALTDTNNSIFIGYHARSNADGEVNQIVIGHDAIGLGSNSVVLGNSSITKTRLYGDVGIGTDSPDDKLQVAGNVIVGDGAADTDYTLTFDGETNDGVITWMEDEAQFAFDSDVDITGDITATNLSGTNTGDQALVDGTTAGQMAFWDGSNWTYTETSEMYWDYTNKRLGIGEYASAPQKLLDLSGDINFTKISAPLASFTLTGTTGGSLDDGAYYAYSIAYATADGDTEAGYLGAAYRKGIQLTAGQTAIDITDIPISPDPRVIARKIYRTAGGESESAVKYLVYTLSDNTTTSWKDTIADGSRNSNDIDYRKDNLTVKGIYINDDIFATMSEWNSGYGYDTLSNLTTGYENFAFGRQALRLVTTGHSNVGIGPGAGTSITTGDNNVAISYAAMSGNNGTGNIAIGYDSLRQEPATNTSYNVAVGYRTGLNNASSYNSLLGYYAGYRFGGDYNTFLGANSGRLSAYADIGDYNIFVGYYAGDNATAGAEGNILIGKDLDLQTSNGDNQLSIGNLIFGTGMDGSGTTVSTGKIGIGMVPVTDKLEVAGNVTIGNGAAGTDYTLTFNGETNDGVITWMEDEAQFNFIDDVYINTNSTNALIVEQDGVMDNTLVVDTTNGRVGVGIANPTTTLDITDSDRFTMRFRDSSVTNIPFTFSGADSSTIGRINQSYTASGGFVFQAISSADISTLGFDAYVGDTGTVTASDRAAIMVRGFKHDGSGGTTNMTGIDRVFGVYAGDNYSYPLFHVLANGTTILGGNTTIGTGVADTDYTLNFDGETNDGVITWMEDEAQFAFDSDVDITGDITATNLSGTNTGDQALVDGTIAGQMAFWDGSNWTYAETSEMYWDDTNKYLGVGNNSPDSKLYIYDNRNSGDTNMAKFVGANGSFQFWNQADFSLTRFSIINGVAIDSLPIFASYITGDTYNRFGFAGTGKLLWGPGSATFDVDLYRNAANQLRTSDSLIVDGNFTLGSGTADTDYTLTFNGQSNDTVLTWMEDEDYLKFVDDLFVDVTENIYFRDTSISINSADDGYLDLNSDTGVRINSASTAISNALTLSSFGAGTLVTDASGNVSVSSDERLKNINGNFNRGIEDLMGLNPISFHWKDSAGMDTENAYVGFSAQNVQQYIPEAVGEDTRGYLTLFDRPILATVVNSVKGQQEQMSDISNNIFELSSLNQDLILKTDENISTLADLQDSIDDNLSKINNKISSQEEMIGLLQAQIIDQDNRVKSVEDMAVTLQDTQDLISSRVDLNKTDLDYIKMVLGLDGTGEIGNIKISGQLEAEKVVAGAFSVKQTGDKTLGTITIKAGDTSVTIDTQAININSKVFVTPNQPVEIGVVSIKDRESFKVKINDPLAEDLKVDWWIVDED